MTNPPKLGRPPSTPAEKHSAQLRLKLTPAQRAEYDAAAKRGGKLISEWAKDILRRAAKRGRG